MTRTQIIELMARAFDSHYKHLGVGPCEIAYTLANDAVRVLTAAGLAILPIEPSEAMIAAARPSIVYVDTNRPLKNSSTIKQAIDVTIHNYSAMITAAIKERE